MTSRIVVLGAGYSGQIAARLAARQKNTSVTLVNERDRFVERVRMHQHAAGQDLRERPLAALLAGTGVELVIDRVTGIDPAAHTVALAGGETLAYDTLVYALGSSMDFTSVPGVAEHAYTVAVAEEAARLRVRLRDSGVVTVVGGGLTGIEAATEFAEQHQDLKVRLVTGGVLGVALSEKGRRHLRRTFARLGIEIRDEVRVAEVHADGVELTDGAHIPSDVVVWTTGFTVPALARDAGLAVDEHGRLVVDDTGRSMSHPDVYGVGDAAAIHMEGGQELRMACATGLPMALQAAKSIAARRAGREPEPLKFRYVNQCISLGRRDALIQFVDRYDRPKEAVLTGRVAALYKELIVKGAYTAQRHPAILSPF